METDRRVTVITYEEYLALRNSQELICQSMDEIKLLLSEAIESASKIRESNKSLENLILEHISREQ